ncbi:hypothetical protein NQ315_002473 [Exocentrus adspersus]|uniref:Uncharacterized protein n=1 Tax=Exocentrus adspersus TaxID=1586481 RepID=A0AAV8VLF0_9CUCU|nr:hypothetical protein NQ315_002473 [Exocentrus adspersus]
MFQGDGSYEFGYDIHNPVSNDIKSHHEVRDGKNVLGFYTFKEADGSIRIVKYKVGPETGFEAVVENIKPEPVLGNSIDGQEASPSTHGAPETVNEPVNEAGYRSRYVSDLVNRIHRARLNIHKPRNDVVETQDSVTQNQDDGNEPVQNHGVRRPEEIHRQPAGSIRNPYIIRRGPYHRNVYHQPQLPNVYDQPQQTGYPNQGHGQKVNEGEAHVNIPSRGRHRNQYIPHPQPSPRQQQIQHILQPYVRNHDNRVHGQTQPYVNQQINNAGQPLVYDNSQIVYIDGVPYIDNEDANLDDQNNVSGQEQVQNPQYEVRENPEGQDKSDADEDTENLDEDEAEDYEEEDEEDDENAEYEEDDENDHEDVDATEFLNENEKIYNEQQKEYDRIKKAYAEAGRKSEASEEDESEQPVSEQIES